jgi:hypothetical protein
MANLYLGISGSEILLPTITGLDSLPNVPVNDIKEIQVSTMGDGSKRYALYAKKKKWAYSWGFLDADDLATLQGLYALNQQLSFQNGFGGATWYNVVILSFNYDELHNVSSDTDKYYSASMTIAEV